MKLTAMTYNIFSGKNLYRDLNLEHAASVIRQVNVMLLKRQIGYRPGGSGQRNGPSDGLLSCLCQNH